MAFSFKDSEENVLAEWEKRDIEHKVLAKESPKGNFVFFEGPPTANAAPALHHVLTRVYKDVVLRFRAMQGYHVDRKAGWDTHGLPVELQVEKKLQISGKPMIENIIAGNPRESIIAFNKECKDMVWSNVSDWEKLTKRIGYWLDTKDPYITYDNNYIESVWWVMKQLWDKNLVYKGHKVVPFCTRCGTALSSHEVAQGYKTTTDTSVYVKFKVAGSPNEYLLSWTTTPWTLPGNVALAVGSDITYSYVQVGDEVWILSSKQLAIIEGEYSVIKEVKGSDLIGLQYEPLFNVADLQTEKSYKVYGAEFVTDTDGVGIVHTAVMYGEDDYYLGLEIGLPQHHTVSEEGVFVGVHADLDGKKVKDPATEKTILEYLEKKNLLIAKLPYKHEYPFCWRCSTPLLYYARSSWFIKMENMRSAMLERNANVRWEPEYIRDGRFGEWLANARDWAISRERYWGTPLPIWECACGEMECVGSRAQVGMDSSVDLHRPFVDDVTIPCRSCGKDMHRVKEVLDVWFDSGAMPIAQWGFPAQENSEAQLNTHYPADYICEAIDQTRGWFYTLLAIATLLERPAPYKNVICLGHLLDSKGEKMSKSKGNVIVPWEIINEHGVDPLRWYLFSSSSAGEPKRFDLQGLEQAKRRTLMILWNVADYYSLFASLDDGKPSDETHVLDQYIVGRTKETVARVTEAMEHYDVTRATRILHDLVDDTSTWYVRRSRDRFKDGDVQAVRTLREVLHTIARMFAPFTPFFAESLYARVPHVAESVHLDHWPSDLMVTEQEKTAMSEMKRARAVIELGLALRAGAKIKIRQPLQVLSVDQEFGAAYQEIIADELNVKQVVTAASFDGEWVTTTQDGYTVSLNTTIDENLQNEGIVRELTRTINGMRKNQQMTLQDRIVVMVQTDDMLWDVVERATEELCKNTLATHVVRKENITGETLVTDRGTLIVSIENTYQYHGFDK